MRFKLIVFMLLIVLFTIFVVQNTEPISLLVFLWRIEEVPKVVLLIVTLALGIIMGIIISTLSGRKNKVKKEDVENIEDMKTNDSFNSGNL